MSNIFVTDIVGTGTYAVPTNDTELASATSGLDTLLSAVANLAYDRVLSWVEDFGGPDGAEGSRTLNCLIEKMTYSSEECPSESEVDTMIAAIESALEADANITSVGNQQVHIFQAGAYFLWNRDVAGGFLYPSTPTDDIIVGASGAPAGKWFDDGDIVFGAAAMSGTEKLRVVGSARIDTNGQLLIADSATIPPWNITERSAAPSSPSAGDIYVDDGTNTGSGNPGWRRYTGAAWEDMGASAGSGITQWNEQNIVHVAPHGNDSNNGDAINKAKLTIGSAITRATALTPSSTNRITILIHPGEYDEVVSTANSYVDLIGVDRDACIIRPSISGIPLYVNDNNVRVSNLTIDKTGGSASFSLWVRDADDAYISNVRVIMDVDSNDDVYITGATDVTFRDCIFENVDSDAYLIWEDDDDAVIHCYNCTFRGRISSIGADYYFYGCRFECSVFNSTCWRFTSTTNHVLRIVGCSFKRTANVGKGIRIGDNCDYAIIGCDIDGAGTNSTDTDIEQSHLNLGFCHGNVIGRTLEGNVFQRPIIRKVTDDDGGVDAYTLQKALDSLPYEGGVVELQEDIDIGEDDIDIRAGTTGEVVLEGNGFTISGDRGSIFSRGTTSPVRFRIQNVKFEDISIICGQSHIMHLYNVQVSGIRAIVVSSTATEKLIVDNVDVDGSSLPSGEWPIEIIGNGAEVDINDSSFVGRNVAGSQGAAIYLGVGANATLKAINSLFIHGTGGGGGSDYEIDANAAQTVYTQYCMTRAKAIGAAPNITEGMGTTNNIVGANVGFLWRE